MIVIHHVANPHPGTLVIAAVPSSGGKHGNIHMYAIMGPSPPPRIGSTFVKNIWVWKVAW